MNPDAMVPVRGEARRRSDAAVPHEIASGFILRRPVTAGGDARSVFDAYFARLDLTGRDSVVAAISGGSDSTALLFLLEAALRSRMAQTKLLAVTIDHRLRPDSAAEAAAVARLCADHRIAHRTLCWTGPKPKTGLQAAAREARYRLLAQAASASGTDIVFTGHTLDDQAETIAMRRRRGAGHGLAGMSPATLYGGRTWILRPLLETSRAALRDRLVTMGIGWIDDPSNRNTSFERVRVRRDGAGDSEGAFEAAAARTALGRRAADLISGHAALAAPGLVRLGREFFEADDRDAGVHAFRVLLAVSGGVEHLPDLTRSADLFDRIGTGPHCATLSRVVVDSRRAGIFLRRELRDLPVTAPLHDGMIWDGRFRIDAGAASDGRSIEAFGSQNAGSEDLASSDAPKGLVRAALGAAPAVRSDGVATICLRAAARTPVAATPLLAPWARFLPSFDLVLARATAALIGAPHIPASPCEGHKRA